MALSHEINRFNKLAGEALTDTEWRDRLLNANSPMLWTERGFDNYLADLLGEISADSLTDFTEQGLNVIQENYRTPENPFDATLDGEISPDFIRVIKRISNTRLNKNDVAMFYFSSDWDEEEIPAFIQALNTMLIDIIKVSDVKSALDVPITDDTQLVRLRSFERTRSEYLTPENVSAISNDVIAGLIVVAIGAGLKFFVNQGKLIIATVRFNAEQGVSSDVFLGTTDEIDNNTITEETPISNLERIKDIVEPFARRFLEGNERFAVRTNNNGMSRTMAVELELERIRMGAGD